MSEKLGKHLKLKSWVFFHTYSHLGHKILSFTTFQLVHKEQSE